MLRLILLLLLLLKTTISALDIDNKTTFNELLTHSQIYIDKNCSENILTIQNREFKSTDNRNSLGFGYSPKFAVWIRFSLTNKTDSTIDKIIEYDNPLTSYVKFFEKKRLVKRDGLLDLSKDRYSLTPILRVTLKPYESREFYIRASSFITTLIVKLNLWGVEAFYHKELIRQVVLALFFGAMGIIILYNSIIFFATRELSYLYYVLFFMGTAFHHLMYKGVATLYLFSSQTMQVLIYYSSFIVAIPTIFLALFTQKILRLKEYPRLNRVLNYLMIFYPMVIMLIQLTDLYQYRSLFSIVFLLFLFFVTCYTLIKKNRQARFIIIGWILFVSSGVFMYLSSLGRYNIFEEYPYLTELSLALEVVVFSLALASKIKMLNQEKLISQKRGLLLRELNHRVKNSMQTILSFLILQKDKIDNKKTEEILQNLENRIMATTHLYSLLHTEENMVVVDTAKYFSLIAKSIQKSFEKDAIVIDIKSSVIMDSESVIYCGFIVNEAVTNAFKYAFENRDYGRVEISLSKKRDEYHLGIKDNGSGFKDNAKNGLGLDIIRTLATLQLDGSLDIKRDNGVQIDIVWSQDEK